MRYYLTVQINNNTYNNILLSKETNTGNLLFSFESMNNAQAALAWVDKYSPDTNWIVDSGAFAAWNTGKVINRQKLLEFYKQFKKHRPNARFVNLDIIPGKRGRKPNRAEALKACQDSWENYLWFRANGVEVMPVFHEDDPWEYLYMMMKETDYFCISPANDSSVKRRMVWLDGVFSIIKADYKTHGLAATSEQLLKRYPFYSVDSINWVTPWMYGRSSLKLNARDHENVSKFAREPYTRNMVLHREIDHYIETQERITRLWEKRGVKWKD